MENIIIGLTQTVSILNKTNNTFEEFPAKIDTGADISSIDEETAIKLGYSEVCRKTKVRSATGTTERKVTLIKIKIKDKLITAEFTLKDRKHMKFPILIGKNILRKGFLINPRKE